jgi:wyosine [tRNA(Phe)-imidazoG37] synthetase (radical SAM superfamily)
MSPRDPDIQKEQSHHPREFADFTYVYPVLSRRSGGVSIGVNLNLDKHCNFDCPYCQVDRTVPKAKQAISIEVIRGELEKLLSTFDAQGVCRMERFKTIQDDAKKLTDIAVSGDGEPTMVPEFLDVCRMLSAMQALHSELDFKLILITNSTLLDRRNVLEGISHLLSRNGEVWAKLDAGTEEWYQKVNASRISLDRIESNLIRLGDQSPFKIQSLFCGLEGNLPDSSELDAYLLRLRRIQAAGCDIREVQLHTLARKPSKSSCTPVPAGFLESIRERIQAETGLPANVYGIES